MEKLQTIFFKAGIFLEKISDRILLILCLPILGGLTFFSFRYTGDLIENTEIPIIMPDNAAKNILTLFFVTAFIFLFGKLITKKLLQSNYPPEKIKARISILVGIISFLITLTCVIWISICQINARADGATLCQIAERMKDGNYDSMLPSNYMHYYPHQFNLLFVIQTLFSLFGMGNYQSFQYINALLMPLLFYSGYKILQLICSKIEVIIYYVLLFITNVPLFMYVSYVYGEISSITFTMVFMWQIIRYCKTNKKSCLLWGSITMLFSYIMRSNSLIVLIAAIIILFINSFKKIDILPIIWFLGTLLSIFAVTNQIKKHYEDISGYEVSDGVPYVAWVYMGLNESKYGPGWFNASNCLLYEQNHWDADLAAQDALNKINIRLEELWNNKKEGVDFFKRKILSQWIEPTCHAFYETSNFVCKENELYPIVHYIYFEYSDNVRQFADRYQSILYFYAAVMVGTALFRKKESHLLENRILLISFLGGFLFHFFWEVMARYALPYMVYLVPVAAIGMGETRNFLENTFKKIWKKISFKKRYN